MSAIGHLHFWRRSIFHGEGIVEAAQEEQVSNLFDDFEWIGETVGGEIEPQRVDLERSSGVSTAKEYVQYEPFLRSSTRNPCLTDCPGYLGSPDPNALFLLRSAGICGYEPLQESRAKVYLKSTLVKRSSVELVS